MQANYDTNFSRAYAEHKRLLVNIKQAVETLFLNRAADDSVHCTESLLQLHTTIEHIFVNGIRIFKPDQTPDCWSFIEGLNWLNPSMTISIANHRKCPSPSIHIPVARIKNDKALSWIYENLDANKLSHKLKYLVSDTEHLNGCYEVWAFLQNERYMGAFFLCLRAVENNQPNLLSQIDSTLLCSNTKVTHQHKRSTSHPDFSYVQVAQRKCSDIDDTMGNELSGAVGFEYQHYVCELNVNNSPLKSYMAPHRIQGPKPQQFKNIPRLGLRSWGSLPDIQEHILAQPRTRSKTISQPMRIPNTKLIPITTFTAAKQQVPSFSYIQLATSVDSGTSSATISQGLVSPPSVASGQLSPDLLPISLVRCDDIKIHFDRKYAATSKATVLDDRDLYSASVTSDETGEPSVGLLSCLPMLSKIHSSDCGTEKQETMSLYSNFVAVSAPADFVSTFIPKEGEKLQNRYGRSDGSAGMSPVFSNIYTGDGASHGQQSLTTFLHAAQFSRAHNDLERENAHFSLSEAMISAIEQIKWRKCKYSQSDEQQEPKSCKRKTRHMRRNKSDIWDTNTKYRRSIMSANNSSTNSSDDESHSEDRNVPNKKLHERSLSTSSLNDHTAYAEWGDNVNDNLSAESVALSLISKFSDKQLPRACDLLWLVSEQDTPQQMLPMPGSWTVSPDDTFKIPFTRGTRDWAPPRAQIIFTRHPTNDRKTILHRQNQKCAGCGMRVAAAYSHRFRYCEYLGKYHCTGCHRNQISLIPARVLDRWEFTNHPVSVFAYRLLDQIWTYPLFRVSDLNKNLYVKIRALQSARQRRIQLHYVQDFIMSCRFAEETKTVFNDVTAHITSDVDIWAMSDFVAVRNGTFERDIITMISKCEQHVLACELCTARGFICEVCPRKQVIFPWQPKIRRCKDCGACVHDTCWKEDCAKCQRLRHRQPATGSDTTKVNSRKTKK